MLLAARFRPPIGNLLNGGTTDALPGLVEVPAKGSARVLVFAIGQGRDTDAVDAHSVAVVAERAWPAALLGRRLICLVQSDNPALSR